MIRILHVITGLNVGGAERALSMLLPALDRTRFDSSVLSLLPRGPMAAGLEADGFRVFSVGMRRTVPSPRLFWAVRHAVRSARPDLISGWMPHGNLAAYVGRAFAPTRVPVVWTVHQSLYTLRRERALTVATLQLCAAFSRAVDAVAYVSTPSRLHHAALGFAPRRELVIPNGFDVEGLAREADDGAALRREVGAADGDILVGLVARFDPLKDHANFVAAATRAVAVDRRLRFVLAGKGVDPANGELAHLVGRAGIRDRVALLGHRDDVYRVMGALDIAVSSSLSEAFPMAVGEAMACGVPCVVTDVGDCAHLVGDTGVVVPPRDPRALARGILRLAGEGADVRRQRGGAARARIRSHFSIEAVARQYQDLYADLAPRSRPDPVPLHPAPRAEGGVRLTGQLR